MNDDYDFEVKKKRPEEIFENVLDYFRGETLSKYANSKNIMRIQERITIRALELLKLKTSNLMILDAGCGPGFVSIYLKELGFNVVAIDIIPEFLKFYDIRELNPIGADMCYPPIRPNSFDAIISISALQWIYRDINNKIMESHLINMLKAFQILLKPRSRVIFQFYPKNKRIMEEIGKIIVDNSKFRGNYIIDNSSNPKKRKIFLLLNNTK